MIILYSILFLFGFLLKIFLIVKMLMFINVISRLFFFHSKIFFNRRCSTMCTIDNRSRLITYDRHIEVNDLETKNRQKEDNCSIVIRLGGDNRNFSDAFFRYEQKFIYFNK